VLPGRRRGRDAVPAAEEARHGAECGVPAFAAEAFMDVFAAAAWMRPPPWTSMRRVSQGAVAARSTKETDMS
jgi:hypothetical protein